MTANAGSTVQHILRDNLHAVVIGRPPCAEIYVTVTAAPGEPTEAVFARAAAAVRAHGGHIICQQIFGLHDHGGEATDDLQNAFGAVDWPVTWLDEGHQSQPRLAGSLLRAVTGMRVESLSLNGRRIGTVFEDANARYCMLGDLRDVRRPGAPEQQAQQVFDDMLTALMLAGMTFKHVVRTWFWNDDILAWYPQFNQVRTAFFQQQHVFDGLVPASTGIGGQNPSRAALVAAAFAVAPKHAAVHAQAVPSPLQCPALAYGSSFSRAVELRCPDYRWLTISGTAGIAPDGVTAHVGDVAGQIELTMRVVHAILQARGMTWNDIARGLAYLRKAEDAPLYHAYCSAQRLPPMPVLLTNNVICRDDLLFEIEVDAVTAA